MAGLRGQEANWEVIRTVDVSEQLLATGEGLSLLVVPARNYVAATTAANAWASSQSWANAEAEQKVTPLEQPPYHEPDFRLSSLVKLCLVWVHRGMSCSQGWWCS
eukprot:5548146-Amphidinium_carterae.1